MTQTRLNDIAHTMAERKQLQENVAESFAATMFDVIRQALQRDRVVKVKGLGTFKIIDVSSRESINVNSGERVTIESHQKITFTPDPTMRDIVNKPFAHFETVVLNDGVEFDDIDISSSPPAPEPELTSDGTYPYMAEPATDQASSEETERIAQEQAEPLQEQHHVDTNHVAPNAAEPSQEPAAQEPPATQVEEAPLDANEPFADETPDTTASTAAQPTPTPNFEKPKEEASSKVGAPEEETEKDSSEKASDDAHEEATEREVSQDADDDNADECNTSQNIEQHTDKDIDEDTDEDMQPIETNPKRKLSSSLLTGILLSIVAIALLVASAFIGFLYGRYTSGDTISIGSLTIKGNDNNWFVDDDDNQAVTPHSTTDDKANAQTTAIDTTAQPKSQHPQTTPATTTPTTSASKPATDTPATDPAVYERMDARVRTGAYRIIGTDRVVTVKSGETLRKISDAALGPGMECYIEVYNGLNVSTPLQIGQKIKIPKLQLKKRAKK